MASLRQEVRHFLAASQFLTRVPSPYSGEFHPEWLERGAKYFPLIGAIIGIVCAAVLLGASLLWIGTLPALIAIVAGIALTGGLHEDGLADFFDSLGGATPEARLTIMKDSRLGAYGALALGIGVALKVFSLASLSPAMAAIALIGAHSGARFATVVVLFVAPYAGQIAAAKIKPIGGGITRFDLAVAAAFGLLPIVMLPHWAGLVACLAGLMAAGFFAWRAYRLLGGYTGDVLGAVEQSYEIAFLLGASACA